jgi:hypothetical protein
VNPNESVTLLPEHLFVKAKKLFACKMYLKDDQDKHRQILQQIYDAPTRGHPGISNTWSLVKRQFEEPCLHQFVENYVRGCTKCQESKVITHLKCAPIYSFNTHVEQGPFQYVSMDLITNLPKSHGCDTILTVVTKDALKPLSSSPAIRP